MEAIHAVNTGLWHPGEYKTQKYKQTDKPTDYSNPWPPTDMSLCVKCETILLPTLITWIQKPYKLTLTFEYLEYSEPPIDLTASTKNTHNYIELKC